MNKPNESNGESTQDEASLRYARQISLEDWGVDGQRRISAARVLIVGLGGLGAPVVTYLAGAGVGTLTLNDFDTVDRSNLPRQPLYRDADAGRRKTGAAADYVKRRNPLVKTRVVDARLDDAGLLAEVRGHDLVIDASDNFGTRFAVSAACVQAGVPLVSVAAIRHEGQLAYFDPRVPISACYACLYGESDAAEGDCAGQGVFTPVVGTLGSLAATRALQALLNKPDPEAPTRLHCFDARNLSWRTIRVPRDPECRVCG